MLLICGFDLIVANVLYLESPAGVGFSFSKNTTFYDTVNDKITGEFSHYKRCSNIMFINIKKMWIDKLLFGFNVYLIQHKTTLFSWNDGWKNFQNIRTENST